MDNKYTGEVAIMIAGVEKKITYDWKALAKASTELGADTVRLLFEMTPEPLAKLLSIGLDKHNPMTPEEIMEHSPPLIDVKNKINKALEYAYFGAEGTPKEDPAPVEGEDDATEKKTP